MLASMPEVFDDLVLASLAVELLSWTMMVTRSPTTPARLSENIGLAASSFHSESARGAAGVAISAASSHTGLERDQYRLFILHLSAQFAPG